MNDLANDQQRTLSGALGAYNQVGEGTSLPPLTTSVDRKRQDRYHRNADVAGAAFADVADVSIFAQDVSRVIAGAGLPNDGRVLVRQRIFQTGRVKLDHELRVEAVVGPYGEDARGRYLNCEVAFRRRDRTVPLRMATEHLLPFAELPSRKSSPNGRADPRDGMEEVGSLHLTPEKVTGYASEVGNQIHTDPAFAEARGYRAPIAQGLMQLTALHGVIVNQAVPWEMDLEIRFLRPAFWDVELTLLADPERRRFRCVDQDGKATAEAVLHHLTTEDMEP